jgi:hypothetical protein
MRSTSCKLLKYASVLVFVIAIFLFIGSQIITFAGRRVTVRNNGGQVIGETLVPHDYARDQEIYGMFTVLSGLQLWVTCAIGKERK